jgi:cardiolipin synthase (CMP-forming)
MKSLIPPEMHNLPGVLTLVRIPLGILFPFLVPHPPIALLCLYLGAMSDIVDGVIARKMGIQSDMGGFTDGWIDKVFNFLIVIGVIAHGLMPIKLIFFLFLREIIQMITVPLFFYRYKKEGVFPPSSSHPIGKAATVILVVAVTAALVQVEWVMLLCTAIVALMGTVAALLYLVRDLDVFSFLR